MKCTLPFFRGRVISPPVGPLALGGPRAPATLALELAPDPSPLPHHAARSWAVSTMSTFVELVRPVLGRLTMLPFCGRAIRRQPF